MLAGCGILFPGFSGPGGEDFANASPIASYGQGHATITLGDGTVVELKKLRGEAELYKTFGASVTWESTDGWYLQANATGDVGLLGPPSAYLSIERITGTEHWSTRDPGRCIVDVDKVDATGLKGAATCKGLEWRDALTYSIEGNQGAIAGQKPFDATITFEASP
jgi:hypothetical protein